jgi:hypothetical protein
MCNRVAGWTAAVRIVPMHLPWRGFGQNTTIRAHLGELNCKMSYV